jgi:threonine synthase
MESESLAPTCEICGSAVLLVGQASPSVTKEELEALPPGVWRYRGFLPQVGEKDLVSLGEGATPLLRAGRLGREVGLRNLFIKDESRNPTGSFMDRGSTVLLSVAKGRGVKECTCVTTGNLGASIAAYCAKANMKAHLRLQPNTDQGKLYQMLAYGAEVEATPSAGSFRTHDGNVLAVTPGNPFLLEGEKTTGFELAHDFGWKLPDAVIVPVGTGGHLTMIWRSMTQLREAGLVDGSKCRLLGVQLGGPAHRGGKLRGPKGPGGAPPFAELELSEPIFRKEASRAVAESRGATLTTAPEEVLVATGLLARAEGIFAEPSSASVIAALEGAVSSGRVERDETVVCIITGAGLKDPRAVSRLAREARRVQPGEPPTFFSPQVGRTKSEILGLLRLHSSYGYDLWRLLSRERALSTASVYQHLVELEEYDLIRRGGVTVSRGRERVIYELTKRGFDFLRVTERLGAVERQRKGRAQMRGARRQVIGATRRGSRGYRR